MKVVWAIILISLLGVVSVEAADCNANGQDDSLEFDSDGDGVINACDNCLSVANANQIDSNNDGYGNDCDADLDNNGIVNFLDVSLFSGVFLSADADADLDSNGTVNFLDLSILTQFFLEPPGPGLPESSVTPDADLVDIEGNVYRTLRFENQIWMAENLQTTTFNDGVDITLYEFGDNWNDSSQFIVPRYQYPDTSDLGNLFDFELPEDFYGAVYNTASMNSGKLCPAGWSIPTEQDWVTLEAFVVNDGFAGVEADALKSTEGWSPNRGLDAYGFSLLASGYVTVFGGSTGGPVISIMATSDIDESTELRRAVTFFDVGEMLYDDLDWVFGLAVRCIKD